MSDKINDPGLYRRMSEPFDDAAESNAALSSFFEAIEKLREEHGIPDVLVLCEVNVMIDGAETRGSARLMRGDSSAFLPMIARVYGEERQRYEDNMARLIAASRGKAAK